MALNTSGVLSIGGTTVGQSINLELGKAQNATSGLGDTDLRDLAGVASGTISMNDFYGASAGNLLSVTTSQILSIPPIYFALVDNQSTSIQTFTFTWKYVGQSSAVDAIVSYDGITRSPGYTTPTISQTFSDGDNLAFYVPFSVSKGLEAEVEFEFTLITASVDTVPTAPNNKTIVPIYHNF